MDGAIVLYDGIPGYVRANAANDGKTVNFYSLHGAPAKVIDITDDKFSCRNIDLGYMQYGTNAVYVERRPMRIFKQGIVRNHLTCSGRGIERDALYTKSFANCITGSHMTFKVAMNKILNSEDSRASYAFHRHFALQKTDDVITLKYRDVSVAVHSTSGWKLITTNKFSNELITMIKECGGPDVIG